MKSGNHSEACATNSRSMKGNGATIVGVHLSKGMVRLAASQQDEIVACRRIVFPSHIDVESPEFDAILKPALQAFCIPYGRVHVWAAAPLSGLSIRNLRVPKVARSQLSLAVKWALRRELAGSLKDALIDYTVEGDVVENGTRKIAVTACAVHQDHIENLANLFSRCGFPLEGLTVPCFTLQHLIHASGISEQKEHALILDVGLDASQILLFSRGKVMVNREFRLGLDAFMDACMGEVPMAEDSESFLAQLSDNAAEMQVGRSASIEAFMPVLHRLMRQFDLTLETNSINISEMGLSELYLAGPLSMCHEVREFISAHAGVPVAAFQPLSDHELLSECCGDDSPAKASWFAPAVGLALSNDAHTLNLLHPIQSTLEREEHRNINQRVLVTFIIVALVAGGSWGWMEFRAAQLRQEIQALEGRIQRENISLKAEPLKATVDTVIAHQQLQAVVARERKVLAMISELTAEGNENIQLTDIDIQMNPLADRVAGEPASGGGAKKENVQIKLKGRVFGAHREQPSLLAAYHIQLAESPLFRQVRINESVTAIHANQDVLQFGMIITPTVNQYAAGGTP